MTTLFKYVQAQNFALAGAGAIAGATTVILKSFKAIDGTTDLTMTDFGAIGFATIEPGNGTQEEQISFTGVTQNANGTATLTGVKTVLFVNPYTATSGLAKTHPGSATIIITNTAGFYDQFAAKANDEIVTGYWEGPDPLTPQGYVTNAYMLALINGGIISFDSMVELGIAGENISAGNLIYFDETQNEWMKCDADTLTTIFNVKLGIAQGAGTNGTNITGGVLTRGSYTTSGLTQGDLCYASNTAGGINSGTAGTIPRVIGIAKDTTTLYFDPDFQNTLYDYAVDAVRTDSYAITLSGALSVPYVGMEINIKVITANTGACTLAVNGGAAKAIVKGVSTALATGDIVANQIIKLVYDGTNWLLVNYAGISSATEKGLVEMATPTEANAGTTPGGTGAPTFPSVADLPGKHLIGALGNAIPKTYFNVHLLFNLWTGAVASDTATTFVNWVRSSTDVTVQPAGARANFTGTSNDSLLVNGALENDNFGNSNIVVMDWWARLPATSTGDINMGFGGSSGGATADFESVYNSTTSGGNSGKMMFCMEGATGIIYATIMRNGVGVTNTNVSAGITNTVYNNFRIEISGTAGSRVATFYINGTLVATLSGANMPTSGSAVGFGRSNTAEFYISAPYLSLQMNA